MKNKNKPPWGAQVVKKYYEDIIGKSRIKMNREYYFILKININI